MLRAAAFLCLAILTASDCGAPTLPATPPLFDWQPPALQLSGEFAKQAKSQIVPADGPDFHQAWQIELRQQPAEAYQAQLVATVPDKIGSGDAVLLSLWVRVVGR